MHHRQKVAMEHYQEVMIALSECVMKNRGMRPWWPNHDDVIAGLQKTSLSRKPCFTNEKLQWITFMKSWSPRNLYKKTANIIAKNLSVSKCCYWRESLA